MEQGIKANLDLGSMAKVSLSTWLLSVLVIELNRGEVFFQVYLSLVVMMIASVTLQYSITDSSFRLRVTGFLIHSFILAESQLL